jgi:predicted GTPase/gas vesicle protein
MLPEQVVGMARNRWSASIGIDGRHSPDYAPLARRATRNPTDKYITFIFHPKNEEAIINISRSDNIVILEDPIKDEFLENIVLIDTPGYGDPEAGAEKVRDSLPICDLILYLFSAGRPFGEEDIPLLNLKFFELDRIPMIFVITRADEFKLNRNEAFDEERNFDEAKYETELDETWRRLERQIGMTVNIYKEQVILIDNEEAYNIDKLRQTLLSRAAVVQGESSAEIHIHKLNYYIKNSEHIRDFYGSFLGEKITELDVILETAKTRVEEYREGIELTNVSLVNSWQNYFYRVDKSHQGTIRKFSVAPDLSASIDQLSTPEIKVLKDEIGNQVESRISSLNDILQSEVSKQVQSRLSKIQNEIEDLHINSVDNDIPISWPSLVDTVDITMNFGLIRPEGLLQAMANETHEKIHQKLLDAHYQIEEGHQKLAKPLKDYEPLKSFEKIIGDAKRSLSGQVENRFLKIVRLYRDSVFSAGSRQSYLKLGQDIAATMDQLEQDFREDQKIRFQQHAVSNIFGTSDKLNGHYTDQLQSLITQAGEIELDLQEIQEIVPSSPEYVSDEDISTAVADIRDSLSQRIKDQANYLLETIHSEIVDEVKDNAQEYRNSVKRERSRRRWRLAGWTIIGFILAAILSFGSIYLSQGTVANSPFWVIWLGVASSVVFAAISFIIGRIFNNLDALIDQVTETYNDKLRSSCSRVIRSKMEEHEKNPTNVVNLENFILEAWQECLIDKPHNNWKAESDKFLEAVRSQAKQYSKLKDQYTNIIKKMADDYSGYFRNSSDKAKNLEKIANDIREEAIQPSFDFLRETKEELSNLKDDLEAINFQ